MTVKQKSVKKTSVMMSWTKKRVAKRRLPTKRKPIAKKKPTGRPSSLTPALGIELCDRLVSMGSLRTVCEADDMPSKTTVFRWLLKAEDDKNPEIFRVFRDQYVRAREHSYDNKFDELEHDLKDAAISIPVFTAEGAPVLDSNGKQMMVMTAHSVSYAKLKLDAFKWQAGKENPKKYGDKLDVEHGGSVIVNIEDKDTQA